MLERVTEEIQLTGWHFNKEECRILMPDSEGFINIPIDVHRVTFADSYSPYVKKGSRLYDSDRGTYKINKAVVADITRVLPFEEMPLSFRHYAAIRAARKYQNNAIGSENIRSFQERDELEAKLVCMKEEQAAKRPNIKTNMGILNGWSVAMTLRR